MTKATEAMRVWIVGASSGIGEQCAVEFARHGEKLILSARREDELERVRKRCMEAGAVQAEVLPLDLADTASLEARADSAWNTYGGLDILLCNAGISQRCDTDEAGMGIIRKVMEIDYFAPVTITKRILSHMLRSGGGRLACTGSIAGLFGSRQRCAYSSAKAALQRFYETIAAEYHDRGIYTTVLIPGRIRTEISLSALEASGRPHGVMDPGQEKGISAEKAARTMVKAIYRKKREKLVGGYELAMAYIKRFFPALAAIISRKVTN